MSMHAFSTLGAAHSYTRRDGLLAVRRGGARPEDDIANFHPSNGKWWVSASTGRSFSSTVEALGAGRVLVLPGKSLERLMRREPDLAETVRGRLEVLFASRMLEVADSAAAA